MQVILSGNPNMGYRIEGPYSNEHAEEAIDNGHGDQWTAVLYAPIANHEWLKAILLELREQTSIAEFAKAVGEVLGDESLDPNLVKDAYAEARELGIAADMLIEFHNSLETEESSGI